MLEFQLIEPNELDSFTLLATWDNAPTAYLHRPRFNEQPLAQLEARDLQMGAMAKQTTKWSYFICVDGQRIGVVSLERDFFDLCSTQQAGWVSIIIGEPTFRQRGLGKKALAFIEKMALEKGFTTLEIGVFAFNTHACHVYQRLGYSVCARKPKRFYYDDAFHDDIRLSKQLTLVQKEVAADAKLGTVPTT